MVLGHLLFVLTRFNLLLFVFFYVLLFEYTSFQAVFFYTSISFPSATTVSLHNTSSFLNSEVSILHWLFGALIKKLIALV